MPSTKDLIITARHDSAELEWVPFDYPKARGEEGTSRFGEIAVLRGAHSTGNLHVVAYWRVGADTSPLYDSPLGDETGYVIEGSATIELLDDNDEVIDTCELRAGEMYNFDKGTVQRWTVHEQFTKFVTVADDVPAPA